MLDKLIKYDLKAGGRIISVIYGFMLLCAVFARITGMLSNNIDGFMGNALGYLWMFTMFIMILSVVAVCVVTLVLVLLRYRNNLLRDEGYLMHTLPVSAVSLYFSKIITSLMFFIGDIAVIILSFIISGIPAEFGFTWDSFIKMLTTFHYGAKEYGVNGTLYIVTIIVLFIIALYESIAQFFASINIGYSISGKGVSRDLMSVAVYIVTYIIFQVVMVFTVFGTVLVYGFDLPETEMLNYTSSLLIIVTILMSVFSVIYSTVSIKLMQKKLNLE